MQFDWITFLAVVAACNDYYIFVMTSDTPELKVAEVSSTSDGSDKERGNEESSVKKERVILDRHSNNVDSIAEIEGNDWENYGEIPVRKKRSTSVNLTDNWDNVTAVGRAGEAKTDNSFLQRMRLAKAKLIQHLQMLPVSQQKVIPLALTDKDEAKVVLHVAINVLSVVDVNDVDQTIRTGLYLGFTWHDEALAWNKSLYENVQAVYLSSDSVWTPYVLVINSADLGHVLENTISVAVTDEGYVNSFIPLLLETSCSLDLTLYPFDEQTCMIKFLADPSSIEWDVREKAFDDQVSSALALNSEWELTNVSTRMYSLGGGHVHPEVVLVLRRKTRFYEVCLMLPLMATFYLNTLVFLMPLESGEKISFLVSLYVSTSVFTSFFSTTMPRGMHTIPVVMILLMGVVAESILVLLATLFILRRFYHEQEASAVSHCSHGKDWKITPLENDPQKRIGRNVCATDHTTTSTTTTATTRSPQPLQQEPQPGGDGTSRVPSLSQRVVTMDTERRAARAKRAFDLRSLTSCQLDRIMFVVFMMGNTIFLIVLLHKI